MTPDRVTRRHPAVLGFRFLARQLDERDRAGGGGGTAQADRAKDGPHERRPAAEASRVAEFSHDTWLVDRDHCVFISATTMPMTNKS